MRRKGHLYHLIPTEDNLKIAYLKAIKGKRDRQEVLLFKKNFESNMASLKDQLEKRAPVIGNYFFFTVRDPKKREICAAPFSERVLHHAVMNICEPYLERYAIFDSYACRKNKGLQKALGRAHHFSKKYAWFLKLDIRKYFDSINHFNMMRLLNRRFKDPDLLALFSKLLDTYHKTPGKGLPIGNLISQHLANFYLGALDHYVKEEQRVKGYLRYMDDFILFGNEKSTLNDKLCEIRTFLLKTLDLTLKDDIQLNRSKKGIPFLGFRIFPDTIRLSAASRKRFQRKFKAYERKYVMGTWDQDMLVNHMMPLIAFTKSADAKALRRQVIEKFGVSF